MWKTELDVKGLEIYFENLIPQRLGEQLFRQANNHDLIPGKEMLLVKILFQIGQCNKAFDVIIQGIYVVKITEIENNSLSVNFMAPYKAKPLAFQNEWIESVVRFSFSKKFMKYCLIVPK